MKRKCWGRVGCLVAALAGLSIFAAEGQEPLRLSDPGSRVYYRYALAAGERIQVEGGSEVTGAVYSNGDLDLGGPSLIDGDVSVVGRLLGQGTVTGQVTEGAPVLELPALPDEAGLSVLADRVIEGDTTFSDVVVGDAVLVIGDLRIRGSLGGSGTLMVTGDIDLDGEGQPGSLSLDPDSRLSLIALGSVRLGPRRPFRGVVRAGADVELHPGVAFEGVAVAGGTARVLGGSTVRFLDFDQTPPAIALAEPPDGGFLATATPRIEIAWSDGFSGVDPATASFVLDGADVTAAAAVSAEGLTYTPPQPLADGFHVIEVAVADRSDNEATARFTFTTDSVAPAIDIVRPAGTVAGDPAPQVLIQYSDGVSGVDLSSLVVLLDGASLVSSCTATAASATCQPPDLADGFHTVHAEILDRAGNRGLDEVTFEIVLDQDPPAIAFTAPELSVVNDRTPRIALEYSDAQSGVDPATLVVTLDEAVLGGCQVGTATATCTPPPLAEGPHDLEATVRDAAGNEAAALGFFELFIDEDAPRLEILSPAGATFVEGSLPGVTLAYSDAESPIDPASLRLSADGFDLTATCAAGESLARCPAPVLDLGPHVLAAEIADTLGNRAVGSLGFQIVADSRPPRLEAIAPAESVVFGESTPEIRLRYSDDATGVDPATLAAAIDGVDVTAGCAAGPEEAVCEPPPLAAGPHSLNAQVADVRGNRATARRDFEIDLTLAIAIEAPASGLLTREDTVDVSGTVSPQAQSVNVDGVEVEVEDGAFFVPDVPLHEGNNALTAVARNGDGGLGMAVANVVRDTTAPQVSILAPPDGFVTTSAAVLVSGEYNDPSSSNCEFVEAEVRVNGMPAAVDRRAFVFEDLLLQPGENRVEVTVTDAAGNRASSAITVTQLAGRNVLRIEELQGNLQRGRVGETLPDPLTVRLADGFGTPLVNRLVHFEVTRGTGGVSAGGEEGRTVTVLSDERGQARAIFTLGDRMGSGNHEVTVSSPGFPGTVIFCASAEAAPPARIVRVVGTDASGAMEGAAGAAYPKPLLAQVFDDRGNPVAGVEVTWQVILGEGSFAGSPAHLSTTDDQGVATAQLTLGPEPGVNNNVVTAGFAGLEGIPASFTVSGVAQGDESATAVAGIVLDNQDDPVPGVRVAILGTNIFTSTDAAGRFRLTGVPVGAVHLVVAGHTTTREGTWPDLGFNLTTVGGHTNEIGMPIRLLPLDTEGARLVGGAEDVVIPLKGVPGASLTVFANSATFPDGAKTGVVSFTQVHADKVPMVAPRGANFIVALTIQPAGALFDPPAKLTLPNFGDPPGTVAEVFGFDHDLGEFVSAGTATVTADGRFLVSNPGFGVRKAGWHGALPVVPTSNACQPGTCTICTADGLEPKCDKCSTCNGSGGCEPRKLEAVTATARSGERTEPEEDTLLAGKDEDVELEARDLKGNCRDGDLELKWDFGDGETGEGRTTSHAYDEPGTFTARLRVTCGGCAGAGTLEDSVEIQVVELDLIAQELPEEDEEKPHEEDPGAFVIVNDDDDNGNQAADNEDEGTVEDEDDLVRVELKLEGEPSTGELELGAAEGLESIRVWSSATKEERMELPKVWKLAEEDPPEAVFVEAFQASKLHGVELTAVLRDEDAVDVVEDKVVMTTVGFVVVPTADQTLSADGTTALMVAGVFLAGEEDDELAPVEDGAVVEFTVAEGTGTLSDPSGETEEGVTDTTVTLPTNDGATARVEGRLRSLMIDGESVEIEGAVRQGGELEVEPGSVATIDVSRSRPSYPADGLSTLSFTANARDQFGNQPRDGTTVGIFLEGFGEIVEASDGTAGGQAQGVVRASFLPEDQLLSVEIGAHEEVETIPVTPVNVSLSADLDSLDVAEGEATLLTATFTDSFGAPVADGTPVNWFTSNGTLVAASPVVIGGQASAQLSSAGGRVGRAVVSVGVYTAVKVLAVPFVSSAPLVVTIENPVLVGEATEGGTALVEQGDGTFAEVPFFARSRVSLQGPAGAVLSPGLAAVDPVADFGFDEIAAGRVLDTVGGNFGSVDGATLDTERFVEGGGSLAFDGAASVVIPATPQLDVANGFLTVWVRPDALTAGDLVAKDGEYRLEMQEDGRLRFSVFTQLGPFSVTSGAPLEAGVFQRVRAELDGSRIRLTINGAEDENPASGSILPGIAPIRVGEGFQGNLDELELAEVDPLAAGFLTLEGLDGSGQIVLDESGSAELFVRSTGSFSGEPRIHCFELSFVDIPDTATGKGPFEEPPEIILAGKGVVLIVPKAVWTQIWNFVVGFAWGEGEGAAGFLGDLVAGFVFVGDIRDAIKELAHFWPGGESPDFLVLTFALVGLALDFVVPAEAVNGAVAATKTILKRLGRKIRLPFARLLYRLSKVGIELFIREGPEAALRFFGRNGKLLTLLGKNIDETAEVVEQIAKSNVDFDDIAKITEDLGDDALDFLRKVFCGALSLSIDAKVTCLNLPDNIKRKFAKTLRDIDPSLKKAINGSETALEGLSRILQRNPDINVKNISKALDNADVFKQTFEYTPKKLLQDFNQILTRNPDIDGISRIIGRIAEQTDPGFLLEVRGAAFITENTGDVIKAIGRESLEGGKIDLISDTVLYQVVHSEESLFSKIAKETNLKKRRANLLKFLRKMKTTAKEGNAALNLPGGQVYKILINGNKTIKGAFRAEIEKIVQIVDIPGF